MTHHNGPGPDIAVWTIGHSNTPREALLELLVRHRIAVLVDVRSSPYSKYASQFNREEIGPAVEGRGIEYQFFGDLLGGRADDSRLR